MHIGFVIPCHLLNRNMYLHNFIYKRVYPGAAIANMN